MEKHIFKKKYGQNFLNDQNILNKIANSIEPSENDLIIEIGPGSGNLTKHLQKYDCNILCYEIDTSLKERLNTIKNDKTTILYKDFLDANIAEDIINIPHKNIYVVANIPYYITTPIIEKLTLSDIKINSLTLMMQKEVGERLTAKPKTKEYGYITVFLNYFYNIQKLFDVSKNAFYPKPNVDSVVLKFITKEIPKGNFEKFNSLIKSAFQFKRKNLKNNLYKYDLKKIEHILEEDGYSLNNRAEDIPLETYLKIIDKI